VETKVIDGKRKNRIVKTIGKANTKEEVNQLKKEAYLFLTTRKDQGIRIDTSKLQRILFSPGGIKLLTRHITKEYGMEKLIAENFESYTDCFYDELVHRFYFLKSELQLGLKTGKGKDRFYRFLDKLYLSKEKIEVAFFESLVAKKKITKREIKIDTTSTYFEGNSVSIAMYGYSRDHRKDLKQVILLLVLVDGYPLFSEVYEGNKKDASLLLQLLESLAKKGLSDITIFTDRGFFHKNHLDKIKHIRYVIATPRRIGKWNSYFDLKEGDHVIDGTRAVLYTNHELREGLLNQLERAIQCLEEDLKKCTSTELKKRHPHLKKFIDFETKSIKQVILEKERKVLGKCLLLTNIPSEEKKAEEIVQGYKSLNEIEGNFRALKTDLHLRPVFHHNENRVKAHIFMCTLILLYKKIIEVDLGKNVFRQSLEDYSYQFLGEDIDISWQQNKKFYDSLA
jgi:transposase